MPAACSRWFGRLAASRSLVALLAQDFDITSAAGPALARIRTLESLEIFRCQGFGDAGVLALARLPLPLLGCAGFRMVAHLHSTAFRWLRNGDEAFAAMLAAIDAARQSVRLETYIFSAGEPGNLFLAALLRARQRGVPVYVLVDAWGSQELADSYWEPLRKAGGEFRWFNEKTHKGFIFRDHRKLLVCDEQVGFVGGFNIAPEYVGDGVDRGWCDVGLHIAGSLAAKPKLPASGGTFPTHGPLFIGLLIGVILILGGLQFLPALALGPIVEHFQVLAAVYFVFTMLGALVQGRVSLDGAATTGTLADFGESTDADPALVSKALGDVGEVPDIVLASMEMRGIGRVEPEPIGVFQDRCNGSTGLPLDRDRSDKSGGEKR